MKTDLDNIQEMLRANGVGFELEQGSRLHIGEASLIFDTLGRVTNGEAEPEEVEIDYDDCPHCDQLQKKIEEAVGILED